jgi:hypothetical protein
MDAICSSETSVDFTGIMPKIELFSKGKIKSKLSLGFIKHHAMNMWMWVLSFTSLPLYPLYRRLGGLQSRF